MRARLVLTAIAMALGVVGWSSGGLRLVEGPPRGALFWTLNGGALAAGASLYLLIVAACFRSCGVPFAHLLKTSLATLGINALEAMGLIVLSWLGVGWITLLVLPAAVVCAGSVLFTVVVWWVAPTFQALRDGSLPASSPFPAGAVVRRVAVIAGQFVLRSYWMTAYGIVDLLLLDALVLAVRFGISKT
jgi:hypothetical protein